MQLQGRSCRKQSSHPGACTWPPSLLQSSRLLPNSFPCRMFHLDQGQQIISRTEEHPKVWAEKGNEEILPAWNGDPLGVPESAFKKTYGGRISQSRHYQQSLLCHSLSPSKPGTKTFPISLLGAVLHCFACSSSLQLVYPERNVGLSGPPAVCCN